MMPMSMENYFFKAFFLCVCVCDGIENGRWGKGASRVAREVINLGWRVKGKPSNMAAFGSLASWVHRVEAQRGDRQDCSEATGFGMGRETHRFVSHRCHRSFPASLFLLHPQLRVWNLAEPIAWEHKQVPLLSKCLITAIYYDIIG